MDTYLNRVLRLALLAVVAAICVAGCKDKKDVAGCEDEKDTYAGPIYKPFRLDREAGIGDIEFSEDGRKFCFVDANAEVGVVDLESGQVLWSRSTHEWGGGNVEWMACEFLNDDGDVVVTLPANGRRVSIVPADPGKDVRLFQASGEWSDLDYVRLSKAFVENRHAVDLSGIEGGRDVDPEALRRDLDRFCEYLTFMPELWQESWALSAAEEFESDTSVALALLETAERAARERVLCDRALGNRLAKTEVPSGGAFWIGVVDVHGQEGVLASSSNPDGGMLSVYSPDDGGLMWWYTAPPILELDDYRADTELRERIAPFYPKFHKYVDKGGESGASMPGGGPGDFFRERGGPRPNVLEVGRKDGRTFIYVGERHLPGRNFLTVGLLENDIDIDWRTLETRDVRKFTADGFQVLVLYAEGRIALWDISQEGGGKPKRLAEGQAVESQWREDETAVGYRDGCGVVSVNDQYWVVRKNKVKGPFTAAGRITAIAIRPPYWVYGTADGKIIFDRLD